MNSLLKSKWPLFILLVLVIAGCKKDDDAGDGPSTDVLASSFQYTIDANDFLTVKFDNFSANFTSSSWDFGDGNTSADESPTHTYAEAGDYTVTLTVSDGTDSKESSKSFTLTDPNAQATLLAGTGSKTWYLQREGIALGIGPAPGATEWWSFGTVTNAGSFTNLGDRPCILDDSWTFNSDGTVDFVSGGTIFIDSEGNGGWLGPGVDESCADDTDAGNMTSINGDDLTSFASGGDYNYTYDAAAGTLQVDGSGFYIGLPNKTSVGDNFLPLTSKTYGVAKLKEGAIADTLHVFLNDGDGTNTWNFFLVSYDNDADLPDIPGAPSATAGFTYSTNGLEVSFTNSSTSATDYSWEFGDGGTSADADPTHTYATEGTYDVTLMATGAGGSNSITQSVAVSSTTFSAAVLSSAAGKVWKLDGANSYFVGEGPGGNNYWPGVDAATVDVRACQFDDEFIFFDNGTMEFASQGEVWAEGYMGGSDACVADGDLVAPYDVCGSGTHAFTASTSQITVNGAGAYVGFNKPYNGAELDGVTAPPSTITYDVIGYEAAGNIERITITINYGMANDYWTMRMISEN